MGIALLITEPACSGQRCPEQVMATQWKTYWDEPGDDVTQGRDSMGPPELQEKLPTCLEAHVLTSLIKLSRGFQSSHQHSGRGTGGQEGALWLSLCSIRAQQHPKMQGVWGIHSPHRNKFSALALPPASELTAL